MDRRQDHASGQTDYLLEDGRELDIYYENPEKIGDLWYPSKIRIELSRYAVTLRIKDILI